MTALPIDGTPKAREERAVLMTNSSEYRKTATVRATKMPVAFDVETLEGVMHGEKGDYLCEGPAGEAWPVRAEIFESTYETVA